MSVNELFNRLLAASTLEEVRDTILSLVKAAETSMDEIVTVAIQLIEQGTFDANKWSSLAFSLLDTFGWKEQPGRILKALVDVDANNGAFLNNYGVFLQNNGEFGQAIEFFARAYATDYKSHGHEKASTFPAWVNLHNITVNLKLQK